ncbi:hypothetical protein L2E82_35852 [Cichorium intybus]|uniref:Uncharacterized protein n=1 Tax=Cichorium intybus TaxID=13427 RepID=A0ACB9BQ27_CICIN|nr:hypothetical protein L2E82_35852 [Cichorium intybus]
MATDYWVNQQPPAYREKEAMNKKDTLFNSVFFLLLIFSFSLLHGVIHIHSPSNFAADHRLNWISGHKAYFSKDSAQQDNV